MGTTKETESLSPGDALRAKLFALMLPLATEKSQAVYDELSAAVDQALANGLSEDAIARIYQSEQQAFDGSFPEYS